MVKSPQGAAKLAMKRRAKCATADMTGLSVAP